MKTLITIAAIALLAAPAFAQYQQVDGYYRSNGTYVQPHIRTAPDNSTWNNLSQPSSGGYGSYGSYNSNYSQSSPTYYNNFGVPSSRPSYSGRSW